MTSTLPNADRAIVDPAKNAGYLLSVTHPDNGGKAEFFRLFGFSDRQPEQLAAALVAHARTNLFDRMDQTEFGQRYVSIDSLLCLSGRTPLDRAIWIVRPGEAAPRFVTAYPE